MRISETAIKNIGPAAKDAVPGLADALLNDEGICRWDGGETVDVSEYAEDELGEFYRIMNK